MSFCGRDWPIRFRFYEAIFILFTSRVLGFSKKNLLHVGEIQARPLMLASKPFCFFLLDKAYYSCLPFHLTNCVLTGQAMGKDKSGTWFRGCHQVPREEVSDDSRGNACLWSTKKSYVSLWRLLIGAGGHRGYPLGNFWGMPLTSSM